MNFRTRVRVAHEQLEEQRDSRLSCAGMQPPVTMSQVFRYDGNMYTDTDVDTETELADHSAQLSQNSSFFAKLLSNTKSCCSLLERGSNGTDLLCSFASPVCHMVNVLAMIDSY